MDSLALITGAIVSANGLRLVLRPQSREQLEREREARVAEIAAGSPERFFEEKRSLEAYPTSKWEPKSQRTVRVLGVISLVAGALLIGRGVF